MPSKEKASLMSQSSLNTRCPVCRGSGLIAVWKATAHSREVYDDDRVVCYAEPCPACNGGAAVRANEVKSRANIPSAFYDKKIDDFSWTEYLDENKKTIDLKKQKKYVMHFIDNYNDWEKKGLGFYIYSRMRGSGKTYLASCICNSIMDKYHLVTKFVSASDLMELDRQGENNRQERSPLEILKQCRVLVIDDLGAKSFSNRNNGYEWLNDILFRILDYRYQNRLITIITSNVKMEQLQLDDRIASRLSSMCQNLPLPEFSFRQTEGNDNKREFFKEMGLM